MKPSYRIANALGEDAVYVHITPAVGVFPGHPGVVVKLSGADWALFEASRTIPGALIQDYLPHLSEEIREALLSGLSPSDWDTMFAEADETERNTPKQEAH